MLEENRENIGIVNVFDVEYKLADFVEYNMGGDQLEFYQFDEKIDASEI